MDLVHQWEGYVVFAGAELLDLVVRPRFLSGEIVARKPDDHEAIGTELFVEIFESRVLRGIAATGGDIDNEYSFAGVSLERSICAVDGLEGDGIQGITEK